MKEAANCGGGLTLAALVRVTKSTRSYARLFRLDAPCRADRHALCPLARGSGQGLGLYGPTPENESVTLSLRPL
jgi:hypothetical protein